MGKTVKLIISMVSVGLLSGAFFGQQARANTITGTVGFMGTAAISVTTGGTTTITPYNPWIVLGGVGDYSVGSVTTAKFSPISYTGTGTGATLTSAATPLWSFTYGGKSFSFDLLSLTSATVATIGGWTSVALSGTGTAHITGLADTFATWSLAGSGSSLALTFDFATATAGGTSVPDGGLTLAMLGLALVGLQGLRSYLRE